MTEPQYISLTAAREWARDYYARIDACMDELMRIVGGIHEQPSPQRVIDLLAAHGLSLQTAETAIQAAQHRGNPLEGTRLWDNS